MISLYEVRVDGKLEYRGPNALVAIMVRREAEKDGKVVEVADDIPHTGQPLGFCPDRVEVHGR